MVVTKRLSSRLGRRPSLLATLVVALLALALVPSVSWARAKTGSLTVNVAEGSGSSSQFKAYQLFSADVADDDGTNKVVSNVTWASSSAQAVVTAQIKASDPTFTGTTAQECAEWLDKNVPSDSSSASSSPVVLAIAKAMMTSRVTPTSVTAGDRTELAEGYWLLVSDDMAVGTGQSGTSPILVVVGGLPVTASTKSSVPTVEKTVLEDSTDAWQKQADATVGDSLYWKLQATIPAGIKGYTTYGITFHDTLTAGLSSASNVRVYVAAGTSGDEWEKGSSAPDGWTELDPSEYTVSSEAQSSGSRLDVTVTDLVKSATDHGMDFSSGLRVVVTYDAPLSSEAGHGFDASNVDTVTLRYPRSPYSDTYSETEESTAVAYTWDLSLIKRDSSSDAKLAGAVLRITDDRGRHLTQSGSWTTEDATVTTDANGLVTVGGVDSGTFDVEEVSAPQGYDAFSGSRRITLSVTLDPDQIVSGKDKAANEAGLEAVSPLRVDSFDAYAGTAQVSVLDDATPKTPAGKAAKGIAKAVSSMLPKTGDPTSFIPVAILVVAGVAAIVASRRLRGRGDGR